MNQGTLILIGAEAAKSDPPHIDGSRLTWWETTAILIGGLASLVTLAEVSTRAWKRR